MQTPWVTRGTAIAAEELASLIAIVEAIDIELGAGGIVRRGRDSTGLLKMRVQFSRRIGEYLNTFGLTPRARADFFRELKAGSLGGEIAARRKNAAEDEPA